MRIAQFEAQAFAASDVQEAIEAKARAKARESKKARLAMDRPALDAQDPEIAVNEAAEGNEDETEEKRGEDDLDHPHGLNAKA
jgi:hypothetical protein